MKNNIIIIITILMISLIIGLTNVEIIFNDNNSMLQILLTCFGLCLTAYTFIITPVQNILSTKKEQDKSVSRLLKEFKSNMGFIFISCVLLIFLDFFYRIDIPFISDPQNIEFELFNIPSLKHFFKIVLEDIFGFLSLYSLYDIMQSIFILVKSSLINNKID